MRREMIFCEEARVRVTKLYDTDRHILAGNILLLKPRGLSLLSRHAALPGAAQGIPAHTGHVIPAGVFRVCLWSPLNGCAQNTATRRAP